MEGGGRGEAQVYIYGSFLLPFLSMDKGCARTPRDAPEWSSYFNMNTFPYEFPTKRHQIHPKEKEGNV